MSLFDRIEPLLPESRPLRVAWIAYVGHILGQGWIATSEILLGVALIAAFIAWRRGDVRIPFHPIYVPLVIFVVASIASAAASYRPLTSLRQALGAAQSAYGLLQYGFFGGDEIERRIAGTTAHVMTYSGILLPLSLLSIRVAGTRKLAAVTAALTSLALLLTFTRGAWLGWLAGVFVLALLWKPRVIAWIVPLLILAVTFAPLPVFARLISSFDFRQTSVLDRIRMAQGGIEMIRDHPILGVGPSNVKETYPLYRRPDAPRFRIPHLHNNVLQLWAERGLLALAAYLMLQWEFLRAALRRRRLEGTRGWAEGGIAAACGLFVAGLFEYNFGDTEVLLNMLDVWALTLVAAGAGPEAELALKKGISAPAEPA
ncbi:MAG: O-antigen ligase family protein [Acidobacteria bacterium]|nr:O-antigen ligase family protein [Acidobacteriota bacterium]